MKVYLKIDNCVNCGNKISPATFPHYCPDCINQLHLNGCFSSKDIPLEPKYLNTDHENEVPKDGVVRTVRTVQLSSSSSSSSSGGVGVFE